MNFDYQMALLQGQMGNLDVMVVKFLDYAYANVNSTLSVQNQLVFFMQDDAENVFANSLKKNFYFAPKKHKTFIGISF